MAAMRGVNLGGWLVLEKWMTPGLFAGVDAIDEYTFMQMPHAERKIRNHHKTFITESDFKWLSEHDIDAVRIPVGYWIIRGDGPYIPAIDRLDWAFRMAKKYKLQVLLCLHGAPGSQNGHDHSGRVGKAMWYKERAYRERTVDVLMQLATRYQDHPQLWGIELLNEPRIGLFQFTLRRFYREAYSHLSRILPRHVRIVFHDAFTARLMNAAIWDEERQAIAMDIHWYHFLFWAHKWAPLSLYWRLVQWHGRLISSLQRWQEIVVGEWSGVISHERLQHYPQAEHDAIQYDHIARQLTAYGNADAWFYWTYKTEAGGIWNYRWLAEHTALFHDKK